VSAEMRERAIERRRPDELAVGAARCGAAAEIRASVEPGAGP
jgi:hypothetical protein